MRKVHLNKSVAFVTTSIEEGLPLPPNPLMNLILESCLARAQTLHPVDICHFVFEANHAHLMVTIKDPDNLPRFMERFKTESAHAVNKLLGRKKKTIWCEGYDSPLVLTPGDVVAKIAYIYGNPAKDNLIDSIDGYPGLSSWKIFLGKKGAKRCPWIRRSSVFALNSATKSERQFAGLARLLERNSGETLELKVTPNTWLETFGITDPREQKEYNKKIIAQLREIEQESRCLREREGKTVLGRERMILRPMDTSYTPDRKGRKTWCICSDLKIRKAFIAAVKRLIEKAREVYLLWKQGNFSVPFPAGLYPPSMPKLVQPLRNSIYS